MLKDFLDHCCKQRTYCFSVKNCGITECTTFQLLQLPPDVFQRLHHLSEPIPDEASDGHYKTFHDIYGEETTEEFM